jgi:hypothetical protein
MLSGQNCHGGTLFWVLLHFDSQTLQNMPGGPGGGGAVSSLYPPIASVNIIKMSRVSDSGFFNNLFDLLIAMMHHYL